MRKETLFEAIRTAVAILVALVITFIVIFLISKQPGDALNEFLLGPIKTTRHIGNIIEMMMPLTFTGLAICVMFEAKQFNLGAAGSFFIGGIAAAVVGICISLPMGIHPLVAILAGGIVGGIANSIPAIIKAKWNASEMVSSLMLNYVWVFLGLYIINVFLRDTSAGAMVSIPMKATALLPNIIPGTRIHAGIIVAALMVLLSYILMYKTKWGYEIRTTGLNSKFAHYSGINVNKVILYCQIIGGVIAGIGGASEILGMYTRFEWQADPGYGWDGVIVAILARNKPQFVPVAAFFLAYLRIGADSMARMTDVPSEVVTVIQGILILLIAAERFLSAWRHKMVVKEAKEELEGKGAKA